jgi:DNA-directed RNA polymerase II subunit RPB1
LAFEKVDYKKTSSNDIREILVTLGIEAARLSLIGELRFVLGSYGIYVNYRHLGTLCDIMTNRGILTAITRHGINRVDSRALRKCSFEETTDMLAKAAIFGELDKMTGVSANIMFGQEVHSGTGFTEALFDEEKYFRNLAMIPENEVMDENVQMEAPGEDRLNDYCEPGNFEFTTKIW